MLKNPQVISLLGAHMTYYENTRERDPDLLTCLWDGDFFRHLREHDPIFPHSGRGYLSCKFNLTVDIYEDAFNPAGLRGPNGRQATALYMRVCMSAFAHCMYVGVLAPRGDSRVTMPLLCHWCTPLGTHIMRHTAGHLPSTSAAKEQVVHVCPGDFAADRRRQLPANPATG